MTRNKKPVVIVAMVLAALIVLPLLLLLFSRLGASSGTEQANSESSAVKSTSEAIDFDLRQLAEKADRLIEQDLAEALRQGDVSLDFIASLKRDASKGAVALQKGALEDAALHYNSVVQRAESQLAALALADQARALNDSTYAELQSLDYLKSAFENTYREAVETYNTALRALNAGNISAVSTTSK
ncbi:hypothetical protein SH580_21680 [Coraliomargarita algicola]|uniref:Uncharacterized protein n=1 Tax=Coraliomargarita algicola TaxID=3092156 RepID=A0ABZ0RIK0_9BACT|nr:hypothetical protein [Coraliomargarita sp. J2-16]WPJ96029.1 hypothetical protein SH580_21680 [Coraliomargarita sp. J2-16]